VTSKSIGFIGLGRMGGGMALTLTKRAGGLHVFDPVPDAMAPLIEAGAVPCESPGAVAAHCDLIFLCLPFAPEVRAVIFGPGGIQEAIQGNGRAGPTIIDTTTLERNDALAIAAEAAQTGIAYWDCPVSGMPFRADEGTLTVMFGGTKEAFEEARPYLEAFGKDIIHGGPLGCGQAMKAINNIIYDVNIVALCEVLPLAVAAGLDPDEVARLVTTGSSRSFASEYFVPRMMARRFDSDFAMGDAYKDIVNVQQMARETGASLPLVDAMTESYRAALDAGLGDEPKSAILKIYEKALGVEFSAPGKKPKQPQRSRPAAHGPASSGRGVGA
jgi:3-hydroxyisobutyrate dehydrogenase-like beta-hydroxyacid dehydrogenase